ncbi:phage tail sheath subtilisin-like domain-containing protein [Insolitispirillum peregrinum]|uniref:phage tail sheath subtilisin-like domain-containing protein n=1 Tax=Insolitispirillum peregrinum TaxID=80876 RepID=UPI00360BFF9A
MTISFNQISASLRTPGVYVEFDNSKAVQGLALDVTRPLMLGQMLTSGSATALMPVRVTSAAQAVRLFGRGSMLAQMVAAWKTANSDSDLWVMPLADNSAGQAASGTITVSGTPTAAGTLALYVAGQRVQVAIAAGQSTATVATAIAAAINADADLIVTASATTTVVTLTCRHKGQVFNGLDLRLNYYPGESTPSGLGIAFTTVNGGSGNPDLTDALAALGDVQYHHLCSPYADVANLVLLEDEFGSRWDGMRQIEGQVWTATVGSHSSLSTLGASRNSEVLSILGVQGSPTPVWVIAAIYTAVAIKALDNDPARPLQTLVLTGMLAPSESLRFTRTERNLLLFDGISTFTVAADGTCAIERAITTYQVNSSGLPDPSYLDVETLATLAVLRRTMRSRLAQKFPRHKLANDGTNYGIGQAIVTPSLLRAELIALAREWETRGWVENIDDFKDQLIVERNADDANRVDAVIPPDLINQLRVFAGQVQFRV